MKRKIDLGNLGHAVSLEVKSQSALEYKATAFEVFSQVIQNTPVKTGRARANWNISSETPDFSTTNSTSNTTNLFDDNLDNFPNVYVANGLDYVVDLENGKSKQAPAGIINPSIAAAMASRRNK
jgi:hypothetical protein